MRYGSVCSGIEAASVAWEPLGWKAAWFSEIAPWPSKCLATRYPHVPNHGSLVGLAGRLTGDARSIDLLVGGTPCQAFSVSGLRQGLADERGNLTLEFARLAAALRPRWVLWENVPGVLSDGTNAFGCLLGALCELGYGLAWRVLDAQFFGLAQRRQRVFLVGHLGAAAAAGAVLFEPEGVRRNPPTRGEARQDVAGTLTHGSGGGRFDKQQHVVSEVAPTLTATFATKRGYENQHIDGGAGLFVTAPFDETQVKPHIAFNARQDPICGPITGPLDTDPSTWGVTSNARVRRLTPRECERLQGFPDDYTAIANAKDTPRYAALGNSMAVRVMDWLGRRIQRVDTLLGGAP